MTMTLDDALRVAEQMSPLPQVAHEALQVLSAELSRYRGSSLELIADERQRQIEVEGCTPEHDDKYEPGTLADAAACYALSASGMARELFEDFWPWAIAWWKPSTPRRDLVKAGALIAAELDRLKRAEQANG